MTNRAFWIENRLMLLLFFLICLSLTIGALSIEQGAAIQWFAAFRSPFNNGFFYWATRLAEPVSFAILAVLFFFQRYSAGLLIGLGGFLTLGLGQLLKRSFGYPRPVRFLRENGLPETLFAPIEGVDIHSGFTSFPSGHTFGAFVLFGLVALLLPKKQAWLIVLLAGLALLVGISRIFLVQHFLMDVAAGAWCGFVLAVVLRALDLRLLERYPGWGDRKISRKGRRESA